MRRLYLLIIVFLFNLNSFSQNFEIGINGIIGFTIVDIEAAMETTLTDWDQFSYGGNIQGFYYMGERFSTGLEIGFHRLYYWEEFYSFGGYYRWGDISTIHFGPVIGINTDKFYAQSGINLRIFTNESGVVPGFMFGGGYEIKILDFFTIPVGLRTDIVFGSATPVAVGVSIGVKYKVF